jgi:hypothetical protein
MNTKWASYLLLLVLLFTSLACSFMSLPGIRKLKTGPTQSFTLNESYSSNADQVHDVNLSMIAGEFRLSGGANALLEGEVQYNVPDWKPTVVSENNSLTISQGESDYTNNGFPSDDIVNVWNVKLGNAPMNLVLEAGAYEATIDLTGIPLRSLNVQDGASESEVRFDALNPEQMRTLMYQTGASQITFVGLANANLSQMKFEGGAGQYSFDFSGDLQQDANITIRAGLSDIEILVPEGVSAEVFVSDGAGEVTAQDSWRRQGNSFENQGSGPRLFITIELGAGTLRLVNE